MLKTLRHLFYPAICPSCRERICSAAMPFCVYCEQRILPSNYHLFLDNPVMQRFWGRLALEAAASFGVFSKGGILQDLVHALKYQGQAEVGIALGHWFGQMLQQAPLFQGLDYIVPVPLHPKKAFLRGYNQAAVFGRGLAEVMGVPCREDLLRRRLFTETQTKKSRLERFDNMESVFEAPDAEALRGKSLLIVDDIITTGATIERCAQALYEAQPQLRLSLAAIALA